MGKLAIAGTGFAGFITGGLIAFIIIIILVHITLGGATDCVEVVDNVICTDQGVGFGSLLAQGGLSRNEMISH